MQSDSLIVFKLLAIVFFLWLLLPTTSRSGCEPRLEWARSHNGAKNSYDYAILAALDSSGNVIIGGSERGRTPSDQIFLLVKYSQAGHILWTVSRAGVWTTAGAVDLKCNVYVVGYEHPATPRWLVSKYDPAGRLLWSRTPESPEAGWGHPYGIAVDQTGHVVIGGFQRHLTSPRDASWLILKYNPEGQLLWMRTYDNPAGRNDVCNAITFDAGNIIAAGYETRSHHGWRISWLVRKYSPDGTLLWSRTHSGPANATEAARDLVADANGNLTVVGEYSQLEAGQFGRLVIRKYNPDGRLLWQRRPEGLKARIDSVNAMELDQDGGILIAGLSWPMNQDISYTWLIRKYDSSGNFLWRKAYSSPAQLGDSMFSIATGPGGVIVAAGYEDRSDLGQATNWLVMKFRQISPCP